MATRMTVKCPHCGRNVTVHVRPGENDCYCVRCHSDFRVTVGDSGEVRKIELVYMLGGWG